MSELLEIEKVQILPHPDSSERRAIIFKMENKELINEMHGGLPYKMTKEFKQLKSKEAMDYAEEVDKDVYKRLTEKEFIKLLKDDCWSEISNPLDKENMIKKIKQRAGDKFP